MGDDEGAKPSRASMREVKREYKQRQKQQAAEQAQREQAARDYWSLESGQKRTPATSGGRRRGSGFAIVALVVAVGFAGYVGYRALTGQQGTAAASSSASPSASASGSPTTPSPGPSASEDDGTDPTIVPAFEGSPAKDWPSGAAGITTPKATQVGIYRAAQVRAAYDATERYLRAALLDPRVTYRGKLDPVFATLGSRTTAFLRTQQARATATKGKKGIYWDSVANRFHVGDWRAAAEVRVKGRMTPRIGKQGSLVVGFTYVAAYWLVPAAGGEPRTIAIRRRGDMYFLGDGPSGVTEPSYGGSSYTSTASVCGSTWPYPDYVQAWPNEDAVLTPSIGTPDESFDVGDLDAADPTGCFQDTSGF